MKFRRITYVHARLEGRNFDITDHVSLADCEQDQIVSN